jgi:hypothetical protein
LRGHSEQDSPAFGAELRVGFYSVLAVHTVSHALKLTAPRLKVG